MKNYYQPEIETMPLEQLQELQSERLVKQVVVPLVDWIRTQSSNGTAKSPYGYWSRRSSFVIKGSLCKSSIPFITGWNRKKDRKNNKYCSS